MRIQTVACFIGKDWMSITFVLLVLWYPRHWLRANCIWKVKYLYTSYNYFTYVYFPHCYHISYLILILYSIGYKEYAGACLNKNDVGSATLSTLPECKELCNDTPRCAAISWNGRRCHMTSYLVATTSRSDHISEYMCYSRIV